MNTKDNKRHQETIQRVYATFAELLREQELNEISVTELCESANIDRSTFYANFADISALANTYSLEIEKQVAALPHEEGEFSWIFEYILENKDLFHVYFKLGLSQIADLIKQNESPPSNRWEDKNAEKKGLAFIQ